VYLLTLRSYSAPALEQILLMEIESLDQNCGTS
jgi:hypothetical protein